MRLQRRLVVCVSLLVGYVSSQNNTAELYIPGRNQDQSSNAVITASLIRGSGSPTSTFLLTSGTGTGDSGAPLTLVEAATSAQVVSTQTVEGVPEVDVINCQITSDVSNCIATRITSGSSGLMTATLGFAEVVTPVTVVAVGFSSSSTASSTTIPATPPTSESPSPPSPSAPNTPPSSPPSNTPPPSSVDTPPAATSSSIDSPATPPTTDQPSHPNTILSSPPSSSSTSALPFSDVNSAGRPAPFGLLFLPLVGYALIF